MRQVISIERKKDSRKQINHAASPSPWTVYAYDASSNPTDFYLFLSFFLPLTMRTPTHTHRYIFFLPFRLFWWLINSCRIRISLLFMFVFSVFYWLYCVKYLLLSLHISPLCIPSLCLSSQDISHFISTPVVRYIAKLVASVRLMKL